MLFDPVLRKIDKRSKDKIEAWIRDQYEHPVESQHTFDEVLNWFDKNNIEFINSVPSCSLSEESEKSFFEKTGPYNLKILSYHINGKLSSIENSDILIDDISSLKNAKDREITFGFQWKI